MAAPVEDLLQALEAARLPGIADELRAYIEEGHPSGSLTIEQILSNEEAELAFRERSPREQVLEACSFIAEQLIEPYLMVEEAQSLAAALGKSDGHSKIDKRSRPILIADPNFEGREAAPVVTEEELRAAHLVAEWLPEARRMMLARLGEDDVPTDDPNYDPLRPDQGSFAGPGDGVSQTKADGPMRELQRGGRDDRDADFIRDPWPEIDEEQILRELGFQGTNIYGD